MSLTLTPEQRQTVHPLWLRLTHWLNALAMLIMVTSGWRIYNASPLFNFSFFNELTLGGWLGGALYPLFRHVGAGGLRRDPFGDGGAGAPHAAGHAARTLRSSR